MPIASCHHPNGDANIISPDLFQKSNSIGKWNDFEKNLL